MLAACITDHATELRRLGGSDRKRLRTLAQALSDSTNPAWLALTPEHRVVLIAADRARLRGLIAKGGACVRRTCLYVEQHPRPLSLGGGNAW